MHYRFQHVPKFSFQHALQISTCAEIFKCFFKMFSTHFKQKNSPMVWTMLKTVLKTMSNISKCVANHVENFKACWKPCQKFWSVSKITVMWLLCDPFHQFWNIIAVIKIKSDIMWSVIEILCDPEEKIVPICMQLLHNVHAMEILKFNLAVNFLYFLSNWVNLLGIFTSCEKLRAFKRNPCFWNRYLMPWRWII